MTDAAGVGKGGKGDAGPRPADIAVEYVQTGAGVPEGGKAGRVAQRDRSLDPKMLLPCANPECRKGGFFLRPEVDKAVRAAAAEVRVDLACSGYVGALRTERGPAGGCPNRLAATVRITYAKGGG